MTNSDRMHINMCTFLVLMNTASTEFAYWVFFAGAVASLAGSFVLRNI